MLHKLRLDQERGTRTTKVYVYKEGNKDYEGVHILILVYSVGREKQKQKQKQTGSMAYYCCNKNVSTLHFVDSQIWRIGSSGLSARERGCQ